MADNVEITKGAGTKIATDEIGGAQVQRVKPVVGPDGTGVDVSTENPMPVSDAGGSLSVDDAGGSLTVDALALGGTTDAEATGNGSIVAILKRLRTLLAGGLPAALTGSGNLKVALQENSLASPAAVRLSDGSEGIGTTAKRLHVDDGGSTLSVDDGGGSLTVDGTVAVSGEPSVKVASALPAGTNAIGKLAANSGVDIGDVDVTSIAAGANLIGDVGLRPRTSGGLSTFRTIDLDETEEEAKASAGQVYGYYFANRASAERFLKFYDKPASEVTVGTTTPKLTLPLPAEGCGHLPIPEGIAFANAITVAATTGLADNNSGAPAEGDVVLNLFYA